MKNTVYKYGFSASFSADSDGAKCLDSIVFMSNCKERDLNFNDYEEFDDVEIIPEQFDISSNSFSFELERLVLPRNVRKICKGAFQSMLIRSVVWPDACDHIPEYAFNGSSLAEISNICHIKSIGKGAFRGSYIKSIEIPDGVTEIPKDCFSQSRIRDVSGCRNVETIGSRAFYSSDIEHFDIPQKVNDISYKCFFGCIELKNVSGLEHIRLFDSESFAHCESLKNIPALDKAIGIKEDAFACSAIECVDFSNSTCSYIEDGAFACTNLKSFKPGYFLTNVSPRAFDETPYGSNMGC